MSAMSALIYTLMLTPAQPSMDERTVEQLTESLKPSVCVITTTGREAKREGLGTGFVISADGLIVTNLHVIGEARPITVEFADGRKFDVVEVHASDRNRDLAVLRVKAEGLKPVPLGDSDGLKDGRAVVVVGHPKGLKYSVVSGVVSGVRDIDGRKMVQIAMPVEPGNSGGPVVDRTGAVQGIVTLKSLVTENLGFAVAVNELKGLLKRPNPIAMSAWVTIGMLDADEWKSEMGSRWTQRAGQIRVEGAGTGFGGRSICVHQAAVPKIPFDVSVRVKLNDERGAAGLIFRHDGERHYGFYPTGGKLRLTRFDGADVYSWKILHDAPARSYKPGEFNTLRVRIEKDKTLCYVNDELVLESADVNWADGQVGLAKFRDTKAEFKSFRVGSAGDRAVSDPKILKLVDDLAGKKPASNEQLKQLIGDRGAGDQLREKAKQLEAKAAELRGLAARVHQQRILEELDRTLSGKEPAIDLTKAALLVAALDNEEVDVRHYGQEVDRMAKKVTQSLPKKADDSAKIRTLNQFLFEQRGFHGSRTDYYHKSNSYLNEVIDDREGLPISLSILYMEIARRIGLDVVGVGMPGHFLVRHVTKDGTGKFINAFDRGELLTVEQAKEKSQAVTGELPGDEFLEPVSKRAIIVRMFRNLLRIAQNDQDVDAGLRYLDGIITLEPKSGQDRMMRAGIYLSKGLKTEALKDVDYLLANDIPGLDRRRIAELRRALEMDD